MNRDERLSLLNKIDKCLEDPSFDPQGFKRFIDMRPRNVPAEPVLPDEKELKIRIQLIATIQQSLEKNFKKVLGQSTASEWKDFKFRNTQIGALMFTDIEKLLKLVQEEVDSKTFRIFIGRLLCIPLLTKIFLTFKGTDAEREMFSASQRLVPVAEMDSQLPRRTKRNQSSSQGISEQSDALTPKDMDADGNARRNENQKEKRLKYDNYACIILKTQEPEVAHVMPHSAFKNVDTLTRLDQCMQRAAPILFPDVDAQERFKSLFPKYFTSQVGLADRKWNMVSLNHQLHKSWGSAHFGLKFLGIKNPETTHAAEDMVTAQLQFLWMPRKKSKHVELKLDLQRFLDCFDGDYGNPIPQTVVAAARPRSGRVVQHGDIFCTDIQYRHVEKMQLTFDIQLILVKIAAMGGGGIPGHAKAALAAVEQSYEIPDDRDVPAMDSMDEVASLISRRALVELQLATIDHRLAKIQSENDPKGKQLANDPKGKRIAHDNDDDDDGDNLLLGGPSQTPSRMRRTASTLTLSKNTIKRKSSQFIGYMKGMGSGGRKNVTDYDFSNPADSASKPKLPDPE
ncbi:hypothetical protein QBC44DRAFT_372417 [Cladorrhinum sp. PSN332]|nr:hypothetical protein QBC44DRAFT_372417 [Cladorrhinum sp. PSN332]